MQTDSDRSKAEAAHAPRRWVTVVLWILAVILMLMSAVYQRLTGPTHPLRGTAEFGAANRISYKLIRSEEVVRDARVAIPAPGKQAAGTLYWRRFKTGDEFTPAAMSYRSYPASSAKLLFFTVPEPAHDDLEALLPAQPPAGKLEYYLEVTAGGEPVRIPADKNVVIRYKGAVPPPVLLTHIILMFFAVLWGIRTLLEALFNRPGLRWMAWTTIILMTVGGMLMGPIVQLYAFGELWTGVPFGWDLTDNKTLVMWLCWVIAVLFIGWRRGPVKPAARWVTILAALVMLAVYLIPHSMYGSELKYDKLEQGTDPVKAIGQG